MILLQLTLCFDKAALHHRALPLVPPNCEHAPPAKSKGLHANRYVAASLNRKVQVPPAAILTAIGQQFFDLAARFGGDQVDQRLTDQGAKSCVDQVARAIRHVADHAVLAAKDHGDIRNAPHDAREKISRNLAEAFLRIFKITVHNAPVSVVTPAPVNQR